MSAEEAIAFIKKQRPATNLSKNQLNQIYTYESQLKNKKEETLYCQTLKKQLIEAAPSAKDAIERLPNEQFFQLLKESIESPRGLITATDR